jgi:hypothetical protein
MKIRSRETQEFSTFFNETGSIGWSFSVGVRNQGEVEKKRRD